VSEWSPDEWEAWRANNRRLLSEGWSLGTNIRLDGSTYSFAEKDGVRIDRTPAPWLDDAAAERD
jgi:hypothetical protein